LGVLLLFLTPLLEEKKHNAENCRMNSARIWVDLDLPKFMDKEHACLLHDVTAWVAPELTPNTTR
jgi:hypothetical protein